MQPQGQMPFSGICTGLWEQKFNAFMGNANPSLASSDFVHFNPRGAKTIAQMFYNAFILEYQKFEQIN
jgi:hypothetical protein